MCFNPSRKGYLHFIKELTRLNQGRRSGTVVTTVDIVESGVSNMRKKFPQLDIKRVARGVYEVTYVS